MITPRGGGDQWAAVALAALIGERLGAVAATGLGAGLASALPSSGFRLPLI